MAYDNWDRSIIWLHKQPLFLWQIALSYKIFGVSEFSLRLPSALMSGLMIIFGYRSGRIFINKRVGFYTAFLFSTSFYMIELISGRQQVDHNDIAFLFYVSASIWAWCEYIYTGKKYWIIFIGVFSGCSILCKWFAGLLVYSGWFIYSVISNKSEIKKYKDILLSFIVTVIIVLPWQIFIFCKYPTEANYEFNYNSRHFSQALEGHGGDAWTHFDNIGIMYGKLVPFILLFGFILLYKKIENKRLRIAFVSFTFFVYLFYTLAKTKMLSYPFVAALPVFMSLACIMDFMFSKIELLKIRRLMVAIILFFVIIFTGYINLDFQQIQGTHTLLKDENQYSKMLMYNREVFLDIKDSLPRNSVLFNIKGQHYVESMFYTGFPSYNLVPSVEQCNEVKKSGKVVVLFKNSDTDLPEYLKNDKSVIKLQRQLQGYD